MTRNLRARMGVALIASAAMLVLAPVAGAAPGPTTGPTTIELPTAAAPARNCTNIGNGDLCIEITPVNRQGHVRVIYTKKRGPAITANLMWQRVSPPPAGPEIPGPGAVPMVARPQPYVHTWPTWIGRGCSRPGIVYNNNQKIWGNAACA